MRTLAYACDERDVTRLVRVLHPDARLVLDGGATASGAADTIGGRARIVNVLVEVLDRYPEAVAVECPVNGEFGIALHTSHDVVGVLTVAMRAERIAQLRLVLDPEKLHA